MAKPAVSILVPIYNTETYLRQCLDSLVEQTLADIQIVCINDGSTDASLQIITEYRAKDARITLLDKENSGYGDSLNKALALAEGDYIGIVEPDDYVALDMFERLHEVAHQYNADVVKSNYFDYCSGTGQDAFMENLAYEVYNTPFSPLERPSILLHGAAIWSAIYKRSYLDSNKIQFLPTPGASYQDTGFCFKAFYQAASMPVFLALARPRFSSWQTTLMFWC